MAANIQTRDIQTGLEKAWHGLTVIVPKIEAKNSGITYGMERVPLTYVYNGEKHTTGYDSIVCMDDGLTIGRPIADSYKLITNAEIFDALESAMGGTQHKIVSCGTVNNREKGFISVALDKAQNIGGNLTESNLNIMWGHGGTLAVIARTGCTTIVCQNTLNLALSQKGEFSLSVRHSKHASFGIYNMKEAIDSHFGVVAEFAHAMEQAANTPCKVENARNIYAGFVAGSEKELSTRSLNATERLVELFQSGKGNRGETNADLLAGATDFYSHESSGGDNRWKQFVSSEFGSGNTRKSEFLQLVSNRAELVETAEKGKVLLANSAN